MYRENIAGRWGDGKIRAVSKDGRGRTRWGDWVVKRLGGTI